MSQRRSAASANSSSDSGAHRNVTGSAAVADDTAALLSDERAPFVSSDPVGPSALQLESASSSPDAEDHHRSSSPAAVIDDDEAYQRERHRHRVQHWRDSPFAVGLVPPTWRDERLRTRHWYGDRDLQPDETGCLCCTAHLCHTAGRVGNMVVLRSSHEWVEEVEVDDETGEEVVRRYTRPRLDCVVGPYWPMMAFVTYPLILGVSGWTFVTKVVTGRISFLSSLIWTVLTVGLIVALALTACRDPGIQPKYHRPPPHQENQWRWTDRAHSYRSRSAFYDTDTAVVVEGFDHTCPWTGTAIGRKNMLPFQIFVCLVFVCMMVNIFLLTGVFDVRVRQP